MSQIERGIFAIAPGTPLIAIGPVSPCVIMS
jgi:hypothetical protein